MNKRYGMTANRKIQIRIITIACLATMIEIALLLLGMNYEGVCVLLLILEMPSMLFLLFGKAQRSLIRLSMNGYFYLVILNSAVELLWNWFGDKTSFLLLLVFASGIVIVIVRMSKNYANMKKGIYDVQFFHRGKSMQFKGFYDTGNCLKDPYSGKGVHIVSEQVIYKSGMLEEAALEKMIYIPYQALGNLSGKLAIYYIDEIQIEGEDGKSIWKEYPIGVTKDNLFYGKGYEIILNEEVF